MSEGIFDFLDHIELFVIWKETTTNYVILKWEYGISLAFKVISMTPEADTDDSVDLLIKLKGVTLEEYREVSLPPCEVFDLKELPSKRW
jgi:hypothetical protein